jgi:uncharacterized membrane protein
MRRRSGDLSTPRGGGLDLSSLRPASDGDAFGRFSEAVARTFGTARFLLIQTVIVGFWIALNSLELFNTIRWDKYPFILLNLVFSTQAAYAAPLILLAQNRQAERERASVEEDREVAARTQADAEFLGRELSSLRIAMSDVVTNDDLAGAVEQVGDFLERLNTRLESLGRLEQMVTGAGENPPLNSPAVPAGFAAPSEEADHPHQEHDDSSNPQQVDGESGAGE